MRRPNTNIEYSQFVENKLYFLFDVNPPAIYKNEFKMCVSILIETLDSYYEAKSGRDRWLTDFHLKCLKSEIVYIDMLYNHFPWVM